MTLYSGWILTKYWDLSTKNGSSVNLYFLCSVNHLCLGVRAWQILVSTILDCTLSRSLANIAYSSRCYWMIDKKSPCVGECTGPTYSRENAKTPLSAILAMGGPWHYLCPLISAFPHDYSISSLGQRDIFRRNNFWLTEKRTIHYIWLTYYQR